METMRLLIIGSLVVSVGCIAAQVILSPKGQIVAGVMIGAIAASFLVGWIVDRTLARFGIHLLK